jgi:hypothetical protein
MRRTALSHQIMAAGVRVTYPYSVLPGRGWAYVLDDRGQRLVVTISRAGGHIAINASSIFDRWGRGGQAPR